MSINKVVESVVKGKVQQNEMFTAHDVTLEVRSKGHKAGHFNVRDIVHDLYSRGEMGVAYTRSTIDVPSGGTPFLYHRSVDDPANYQNIRGQGMVPNPSVATIAIPSTLAADGSDAAEDDDDNDDEDDDNDDEDDDNDDEDDDNDDEDDDDDTLSAPTGLNGMLSNIFIARTPDSRKTLSIPTRLVRNAGFRPKQKVYALPSGNAIEISAVKTPESRSYTVDKKQQIRVTKFTLQKAGIGQGDEKYDVSVQASKILIKKHS